MFEEGDLDQPAVIAADVALPLQVSWCACHAANPVLALSYMTVVQGTHTVCTALCKGLMHLAPEMPGHNSDTWARMEQVRCMKLSPLGP